MSNEYNRRLSLSGLDTAGLSSAELRELVRQILANRIAQEGHVDILGIGNEVLLRGDLTEDELLDYIARAKAALPDIEVGYVDAYSETGWPNIGTAAGAAVPSLENAIKYFLDTFQWAEEENVEIFYFSSFDESWKVDAEGDVGAYWGLWDKDGQPKYC